MYDPAEDIGRGRKLPVTTMLRNSERRSEKAAGWGLTVAFFPFKCLGEIYDAARRGLRLTVDALNHELRREGPDGNFEVAFTGGFDSFRMSHRTGMDLYVSVVETEEGYLFAAFPWGSTPWKDEPLFVEQNPTGFFRRAENFLWDLDRKIRSECPPRHYTKAERRMLKQRRKAEQEAEPTADAPSPSDLAGASA